MRFLFVFTFLFVVLVGTAEAQSVKSLGWSEFASQLEVKDGELVHAGQPAHVYTVVEVPGETFSVRTFFRLESREGLTVYLAGVNHPAVKIGGKEASVRVMFSCTLTTEAACRMRLGELLKAGASGQSLGATNLEVERPILSFLINTTGRFK